jgi:7-cyano-7-deazaguanine synthase
MPAQAQLSALSDESVAMKALNASAALVLFSGGQDSTTCLAWALERYALVETVGFDYGQRHVVEMDVRGPIRDRIARLSPLWGERLGRDHVVPLDVISQISRSALTDGGDFGVRDDGLPMTFVPGRNIVFLTFAGIVAAQRGIKVLVAGTCETDYSGYPDCRDDTIKALQVALNLGMESRLAIETPLMWITKAQTWRLAHDLGGDDFVRLVVEESHTCYAGDRRHRHDWGYGCDACDACALRARGWNAFVSGTAG